MRLAKGFLASAALPLEERYRSYVEVFDDEAAAEMLRAPMAANGHALAAAFADAQSGDDLNRMLAVDVATQLPDDLLMLTDKMSMAVSLECRVPLLDHELCELAAAIPERIKLRGGRLKHVLKEALGDVLPRSILERKKRGFGTPMGAWLKKDLAPLMQELLSDASIEARGLLDPAPVRELMAHHDANRVDGTDRLLALMNLEIWARLYLDQRAPQDVVGELEEALA
jgi:asparagine synthase (glutamine-hydrolysing)